MKHELAGRVSYEIPTAPTLGEFFAGIPDDLLDELIDAAAAGIAGNRTKEQGAGILMLTIRASAPNSNTTNASLATLSTRSAAVVGLLALEHMRRQGHVLIQWPATLDEEPMLALTESGRQRKAELEAKVGPAK